MNAAWTPLPWQMTAWNQALHAVASNRLAHALLLAGPRGVGKGYFAQGLASFLLCESPSAAKPCGACRSCVQIAAGFHPNLLRLQPAEDRRDIAIGDVRELLDRLHLSSHYGQAKIAIVEPADALNSSGVNALLKTVEEPPPETHLLFVAERWRALPATLRSRCWILRFAPPPADQALAWLQSRHPDAKAEALQPLLRMPLRAAQRPEQEATESRTAWASALAELAEGRMDALKLAQGIKREEAQVALEGWLGLAADWLARLLAPAARGNGVPLPKNATAGSVQRLLDDTFEGLRGLERNANPVLMLEWIMIRWARGSKGTI